MEKVSAIFFSCRRLHLLKQTVDAFIRSNTYPIEEIIIVNDSGDKAIHQQLKKQYPDHTLICHPENVGLIKSIDLSYPHIKSPYIFHCEDDWCCIGKGGFIEQSLAIMQELEAIEEVWLKDYNGHPIEEGYYSAGGVMFRLIQDNYQKGMNGFNNFAWHGFTTACGLKRMSDYRKVAPYSEIKWEGTIWHREQAIGEKYHDLGYRTAILNDEYVQNIGYGQSEYKSGYEL
jgi:GT2 family glycosyltransferase